MAEYRLRILHLSDLHERVALESMSEERRNKIRLGEVGRRRLLQHESFHKALSDIRAEAPVNLVCFTGDVADWGLPGEYEKATKCIGGVLAAVGVSQDRLFVVPGNHDVQRDVQEEAWREIRRLAASPLRPSLSNWVAGQEPPYGAKPEWRDVIGERTSAFWNWVEKDLQRGDLLPRKSRHGRLGYSVVLNDGTLPFAVHIIGLDSAWLCGDDNDALRILLTAAQVKLLTTTEPDGARLAGFRLALVHHPLPSLGDEAECFRLLTEATDLLLHGHQHEPLLTVTSDPDRRLHVLAAGSLFEGDITDSWPNSFHVIDAFLDANGRPQRYRVTFWAWSTRGHWHRSDAMYRQSKEGALELKVGSSLASPAAFQEGVTPPLKPAMATEERPQGTNTPKVTADLLNAVVNRDPLVCMPASEALCASGSTIIAEVVRLFAPTPIVAEAIRAVARAHARESGELMLELLRNSSTDGGSQSYRHAAAARYYFDPAHLPLGFSNKVMAVFESASNMDVLRHCIISLGFMGSVTTSGLIREQLTMSDYYHDKLWGEALIGALRQFTCASVDPIVTGQEYSGAQVVWDASHHLLRILEMPKTSLWSYHLYTALTDCTARHSDPLLREWVSHSEPEIAEFGLYALGAARVGRAVGPIAELLEGLDGADQRTRAASEALGRIGTPAAVRALFKHGASSLKGRGLAFCLDRLPATEFETTAREFGGAHKWRVLRAVGLARVPAWAADLQSSLHSATEVERGAAALALARLDPVRHADTVRAAHHEAGTSRIERVLTTLALLLVDRHSWKRVEEALRTDLAWDAFVYDPACQADVIAVLESIGQEGAAMLARAWRPFFASGVGGR